MVVLVHHKARGEETEETKLRSEYMTFQQLKQHSLIKLKEVPLEAKFGAMRPITYVDTRMYQGGPDEHIEAFDD